MAVWWQTLVASLGGVVGAWLRRRAGLIDGGCLGMRAACMAGAAQRRRRPPCPPCLPTCCQLYTGLLLFLSPSKAVLRARSERVLGVSPLGGSCSAVLRALPRGGLMCHTLAFNSSCLLCSLPGAALSLPPAPATPALHSAGPEPAPLHSDDCQLCRLGGLQFCHTRRAGLLAQRPGLHAGHVLHAQLLRPGRWALEASSSSGVGQAGRETGLPCSVAVGCTRCEQGTVAPGPCTSDY